MTLLLASPLAEEVLTKHLTSLITVRSLSPSPEPSPSPSALPSPELSPLTAGEEIPLPIYKAATTSTVDFANLLDPPLILYEDLSSGCGGQLWPAGMVLAKQILRYHRGFLGDARMFAASEIALLCYALPSWLTTLW